MLARAALVLLALTPLAAADTLRVPKDHATIQAAIEAAAAGDTVLVSKGEYPGPIVIDGRSDLVLRGAGHPVLDASAVDHGLSILGSTGIQVIGFDVEGAGLAGILVSGSTDVLVQRCRITGKGSLSKWPVAALQVAGGSLVSLDRNRAEQVVVGLRFYGEGGPEATDCTLTRNVVGEVWHAKIELRGSGHHVERNVLQEGGDVGLFLDASDCTVLRNTVRDSSTGIDVFGGDGAHFERNVVRDTGLHGLHVSAAATGTTLLRDTLVTSGSTAALILDASGVIATETRILKATGKGVQLTGSGCTLTDVRVVKPASHGLELGGDTHIVTGLRVSGAGEDGVELVGDGNALTDCKVSGAVAVGFAVTGDDNELDACTSLDAGTWDVTKGGTNNSYAPSCKFNAIQG